MDRVVEVSVMRCEPGEAPKLVFDKLVNPQQPVRGTEIHGISDRDVKRAPTFSEIAPAFAEALNGAVFAAYNVYFDIKFFQYEMRHANMNYDMPHLCLMYMRPMLGLGSRCSLDKACEQHGIENSGAHIAGHDALASGRLWGFYQTEIKSQGIDTFGQLAELKNYKFCKSFNQETPKYAAAESSKKMPKLRSRSAGRIPLHSMSAARINSAAEPDPVSTTKQDSAVTPTEAQRVHKSLRMNLDALKVVLADLRVDNEEIESIKGLRKLYPLTPEQVRMLHARIYAAALNQVAADGWLSNDERERLALLHKGLRQLGYAPGE